MRNLLLIFTFFLAAYSSSAQNASKNTASATAPLLQRIIYTGPVQYENPDQMLANWWVQALEPSVQHKFIGTLLKKVRAGSLSVFEPTFPFTTKLSTYDASRLLARVDTVQEESFDKDNNSQLVTLVHVDSFQSENIHLVAFDEEWRFNKTSKQFVKDVKGLGLFVTYYGGDDGAMKKTVKLFYIPFNDAAAMEQTGKTLLTDRIEFTTQISADKADPDTADVLHYLSKANQAMLRSSLLDGVKEGKLVAYDPVYPYSKALTIAETNTLCQKKNSFSIPDLVDPEKMDTFTATGPVKAADIEKLVFCEAWYFDAVKMTFSKKVKGVILRQTIFNEALQSGGEMDLFYIPLNGSEKEVQKPRPTNIAQIEYGVGGIGLPDSVSNITGIDTASFSKFRTELMTRVKTGQMGVNEVFAHDDDNDTDPYPVFMNKDRVHAVFYKTDTIYVNSDVLNAQSDLVAKVIQQELELDAVNGLKFNEEWDFVPEGMRFSKKVRGFMPMMPRINDRGDYRGLNLLFYWPLNWLSAAPDEKDEKLSIGKEVSYMMAVRGLETYDPESQEVPYAPAFDNYIEMSKREAIIKKILDDALSGKIKVYAEDKLHTKLLKPAEVKAALALIEAGEDNLTSPKETQVSYQDVDGIRFYESWCYDKTKNSFFKQVKGIALGVSEGKPEEGKFHMLFYVPVNN